MDSLQYVFSDDNQESPCNIRKEQIFFGTQFYRAWKTDIRYSRVHNPYVKYSPPKVAFRLFNINKGQIAMENYLIYQDN